MSARLLERRRVVLSPQAFAEIVVWQLPEPMPGCRHRFKYRLAFVVRGECVLRFDNESGKGDQFHIGAVEESYEIANPRQLVADFAQHIERWRNEHGET
jgi:hypothetical protein